MERAALARILPDLFGYHLAQLGSHFGGELLESSRIAHRFVVALHAGAQPAPAALVCAADALPLAADSVDVLVLPHVLEFADNPHRVLREAERVLIGDGHLVLMGFNPWSWWGLWRLLLGWRDAVPWCGHFYGQSRMRDWLQLLDFELLQVVRLFFRPPLRRARALARLQWLENLGRHAWPVFGGAYLLVAQKRVLPLTPGRVRWSMRRSMITAGLAEPSARGMRCDR